MSESHQALINLILLAHAEIRALRELISLMAPNAAPGAPVNSDNLAEVEAEIRRKHLESLQLPIDRFDALLAEAAVERQEATSPGNSQSPKAREGLSAEQFRSRRRNGDGTPAESDVDPEDDRKILLGPGLLPAQPDPRGSSS